MCYIPDVQRDISQQLDISHHSVQCMPKTKTCLLQMNSVWSHVLKKQEENPAKTQQRTWEKHLDLYLIHLLFKLQQKCYQWKGGWSQSEGSVPDYIRTSVHKSLHLLPMLMKSRWLEVVAQCFIIWGVYLWQVGKQSYKWPNQMWSQYFTIMMFDPKSSCLNKKYLCLQKIHCSKLTDKVKMTF